MIKAMLTLEEPCSQYKTSQNKKYMTKKTDKVVKQKFP